MLAVVLLMPLSVISAQEVQSVILDRDLSSDVDDVGAVAVLRSLADKIEIEILAVVVSSGDPWAAPCLSALNAWFGRPTFPVGMIRGTSGSHESKYTKNIADEFHGIIKPDPDQAVEAVSLYRKSLPANLTIVSLSSRSATSPHQLEQFVTSPPDAISPLSGMQLVQQKV